MENIESLQSVIGLITDGGVLVILVIAVWGFWTGKIMSHQTHEEISEKTDLVVDRLVEKINGSFKFQNDQQERFIRKVDDLATNYFVFQKDIRDVMETLEDINPKLLTTLNSIDEQLKKQNGE
jgi:hypothetical protein